MLGKGKIKFSVMLAVALVLVSGCSSQSDTGSSNADQNSNPVVESTQTEESEQEKAIRLAKDYIQKEEYEKALEVLDGIPNNADTEDLFSKARYGYAKSLYSKGRYADAMEQFSKADGYKDSEEYMEKCVLGKKYERLDSISDWDEEPGMFMDEDGNIKELTDEDQWERGENLLASSYQVWYNSESSENSDGDREMTYTEIDGREYGILSISNEETFKIIWYYLDDPDTRMQE